MGFLVKATIAHNCRDAENGTERDMEAMNKVI